MTEGSISLNIGGRWQDGRVEGGETSALRRLDLSQPASIGRSSTCSVRLPGAGERYSGVAAVLSAIGPDGDLKVEIRNRPGAALLAADGHVQEFVREEEHDRALARRHALVYDGDVLWLPPEPIVAGPGTTVGRSGGYWVELHLPARPVGDRAGHQDDSRDARATHLAAPAPARTFDVPLDAAQRLILTAVCAELVAPLPGKPYWRASTADEVAAMVWSTEEFRSSRRNLRRPDTRAIEQRIRTLVQKLESQTATSLPEESGASLNQRLAWWCLIHVPETWFDGGLAERLLAARPRARH